MATSSAISKCKRKCLFEANFLRSFSDNSKKSTLLKKFFYPMVCLSRHFAVKVSFPWTQSNTGESALLGKREVKFAGYCPSAFLASPARSIKKQKKERGQLKGCAE